MATTSQESMFSDIVQNCRTFINDPEIFHQQNPDIHENFKKISKNLYDTIVPCGISASKSKSLKSLLINGFDDEQVWQQLEIQNKNTVQYLDSWFSQIADDDTLIDIDNIESDVHHVDNSHEAEGNISSSEEEIEKDADELSDEDYSMEETKKDADELSDEDDSMEETKKDKNSSAGIDSIEDDFDEIKDDKEEKKNRSVKYKTKVDDQFFKLSKLEEFLRLEDLKEDKARDDELNESEDEEDFDLFQNFSDDDFEDSENDSTQKPSKDYMYGDFFDGPESGDENSKHPDEMSDLEKEELDSDDANVPPEEDDSESDNDEVTSENTSKTPFQTEQENIKKQILEYEESMVTPKPWQLTGEVDVSKRPIDGLLDLPTDFELNAKPIIIQDKEFCDKLENIIKMTIKNKAYSDGVRQDKPVTEIISMKKAIVIDQHKSKKGLAQEYEELYLKKQSKQEEEENPKHLEIRKFMDSLFPELYALFSHIPKPAVPDIKIVSNLPAVTVEEVAPVNYSDATLLAPEEIKKRTGLTKGQTERTETDRNRERRKKKVHQKMKYKKKEKENAEGKPLSSKATKQEKLQVLKKLKQHKNTKIASVSGEKIKSSKDFFERLQETISSKVSKSEVKQAKKKKKA